MMNCINSASSTTVLAVVFIFTEPHKTLKDHSCQVRASIQNFLQVQQNNTLFMPSSVVENMTIMISKDFANCYIAQFLEAMQRKLHSEMKHAC